MRSWAWRAAFPGAPDHEAFWRQLEAGADAVTDRRPGSDDWSDLAGDLPPEYAAYCRGGFVEEIENFDARFFRVAPIEARMMDPRQRMLLETSWQALEDAGIDPSSLRGSRTGIYAGIATSEYRDLMAKNDYGVSYLGNAASMTVGRVAFHLGLEGPTIPVELNCASSLVAVHHAVASLRQDEVDLALVGGVSAILSSEITRAMADMGMLSKTGRCNAFDASADGFVRGEGCGMVVLKRLGKAQADGDRIWGVILGSAVNQNGASAGPTVPNGPAQERVIEEALSRSGVSPPDVDYLEAHGVGSALGDPIEVQAAAAVYGRGREADRPLLIGSVKGNIGHLETAAGVAGLIKVLLAMKQGVIPKQLHFHNPNPNVDWDRLPVKVTSEATDWPRHADRPPRAAISAFGVSGANSHIVVEGYGTTNGDDSNSGSPPAGSGRTVAVSLPEPLSDLPLPEEGEFRARGLRLLPLSGKSGGALRKLAGRYASWFDGRTGGLASSAAKEAMLADMAWTAGLGRSHFDYRAAVVFHDAPSLRTGLKTIAEGNESLEPVTAKKVAFLFTGEGSQWIGMGQALYESEPVVRAVLNRCDEMLREQRGFSLLDAMFEGSDPGGDPDQASWARPAVYALECALAALWSSAGIQPRVVFGQGVGELAAAQTAAVLSLEEGLRLATARIPLPATRPQDKAAAPKLENPDEFLRGITFAPPSCAVVSGATGRVMEPTEAADGEYWRRQTNEPALLGNCVRTLERLGVDAMFEIGPDAKLGPKVVRSWPHPPGGGSNRAPAVLRSMRRPSGRESANECDGCFVEAVAGAYEAGLTVTFAGLFAGEVRRRISLPVYPFQRRHYWFRAPVQSTSTS